MEARHKNWKSSSEPGLRISNMLVELRRARRRLTYGCWNGDATKKRFECAQADDRSVRGRAEKDDRDKVDFVIGMLFTSLWLCIYTIRTNVSLSTSN